MFSKKSLITSVIVSLVCAIAGLVCLFLLNFDLIAIFMLAGILTLAIIINVLCWKEIVKINNQR